MSWGRHFVRPAVFRVVNALCGLTLGYFGGRLLWNTAHALLERPLASLQLRLVAADYQPPIIDLRTE